MKIILNNVRLAFPKIWEPEAFNGSGDPACSASFLIDPTTQKGEIQKVVAAIKQVAAEKWGAKAEATLKSIQAKGDICLRDGAEKAEYDGFEGMKFVAARSKARPVVVDRNKAPLTQADGKPYGGCYVNASIDVWPQDNGYGKRINAQLLAIQFVRDGDAFGGGASGSADDFDDIGDEGFEGEAAETSGSADDLF